MVCKDKRKVMIQVKAHSRRALKCMDKKITKPLKITDFTRPPGYRKSKRKVKKPRKKIPLPPPKKMLKVNPPGYRRSKRKVKIPLALTKKMLKVNPTFGDTPVDDIVPLRKAKTRGYW